LKADTPKASQAIKSEHLYRWKKNRLATGCEATTKVPSLFCKEGLNTLNRVTSRVSEKIAIFVPFNTKLLLNKKVALKFGLLLKFSKTLSKILNHFTGENWPNLVTLTLIVLLIYVR
jgi:hypothetical protein